METRPSVWIEPRAPGARAVVELVEIPTTSDVNDNIVAYWVPDDGPLDPGKPLAFAWRMSWYGDDPDRPSGGRVVATRRDRGTVEDAHRFVIDFAGREAAGVPPDTVLRGVVRSVAHGEGGELIEQVVVKNPVMGSWRLIFQVRPEGDEPGGAARLPPARRRDAHRDLVVPSRAMSTSISAAGPDAERVALRRDRLLQDWRSGPSARARYLAALGIGAPDRSALAGARGERAATTGTEAGPAATRPTLASAARAAAREAAPQHRGARRRRRVPRLAPLAPRSRGAAAAVRADARRTAPAARRLRSTPPSRARLRAHRFVRGPAQLDRAAGPRGARAAGPHAPRLPARARSRSDAQPTVVAGRRVAAGTLLGMLVLVPSVIASGFMVDVLPQGAATGSRSRSPSASARSSAGSRSASGRRCSASAAALRGATASRSRAPRGGQRRSTPTAAPRS
jgi:hypothetical protein